jgi:glycosyltransferase involved in cell wall biosynthesis
MKIFHIISGLNNGGAEAVLFRLVTAPDESISHTVIVMQSGGYYWDPMIANDVNVVSLNMPNGRLSLSGLISLFKLVRTGRPDVVQTWMYHADLIGGLISRLAGAKVVCWGVRLSNPKRALTSRSTQVIVKLCALLSSAIPASIITCARSAVDSHASLGYRREKFHVIANGLDSQKYSHSSKARDIVRDEWHVARECMVFGHLGRWSPQKDHATLLASVELFCRSVTAEHWKLVIAGPGIDEDNAELMEMIAGHGLENRVLAIGPQMDVARFMSALDCFVLSSRDEGFPNVLAESMACELPCITTDVGDAGLVVDNTGWVVMPGDSRAISSAMCEAWNEMQTSQTRWRSRKDKCRNRIATNFDIASMVSNFKTKWFEVSGRPASKRTADSAEDIRPGL